MLSFQIISKTAALLNANLGCKINSILYENLHLTFMVVLICKINKKKVLSSENYSSAVFPYKDNENSSILRKHSLESN